MAMHIRIAPSLHRALPAEVSVSSVVRGVINDAVENPGTLVAAFANRLSFDAPHEEDSRYAIHISDTERAQADHLAHRFNLSTNQMIQILIEDMLYRAGRWPEKPVDKITWQD